jgi:hypothetical protein
MSFWAKNIMGIRAVMSIKVIFFMLNNFTDKRMG